ncbi:MAG: AMP-binding protein [Deltaproteobacteria bacterium]|jgi:fatty-acyl-CoA synthase
MEPNNLCAALRRAARSDQGIVIAGTDGHEERRTYGEIYEGARRRAEALRRRGLERGDAVIVVLDTSFELVEMLFGVMLAGGAVAPAYPPVAMARLDDYRRLLDHITRATGARFVVTDATIGAAIEANFGERGICDVATLTAEPGVDQDPSPDDIGLIQCTSGSTSLPKPAVLLQRNLMANCRALAERTQVGPTDTAVTWLPLYHDFGLIGALFQALFGPAEHVLMSPARFIQEPAAWWRAVSRHRATVTTAPSFAFGLSTRRVDDDVLSGLDLGALRLVVSGGEPIQPEVIRAFYDRFARAGLDPASFCSAYGLAECCVGVSLGRPGDGLRVQRILREALQDASHPRAVQATESADAVEVVSVGAPLTGNLVAVRDPNGVELEPRSVGEITVRSPSVMAGYLGDPSATHEVIRDGELRTGDLGYFDERGELFVIGRSKHVLIVRGRNFYAEDIEATVESLPGVRKGNAYALSAFDDRRGADALMIAVETRLSDPNERRALERGITQTVLRHVGVAVQRVVLAAPHTLPKTSSGKKQRAQCRALVAETSS